MVMEALVKQRRRHIKVTFLAYTVWSSATHMEILLEKKQQQKSFSLLRTFSIKQIPCRRAHFIAL